MLSNIELDVCSLVILVTIIIMNMIKGYIPIRRTRVFLYVILCEIIAIVCNIWSEVLWVHYGIRDWEGLYFIIDVHFIFEYLVYILFMYYMVVWSRRSLRVDKIAMMLSILPCLVYLYAIVRNCIEHNLYVFDEKNVYLETADANLLNIMMIYCMLFGVLYAIMNARLLSFAKITAVAIVDLFIVLAYIFQLYISEVYFLDFVLAFATCLAYIVLQNPFEMFDEKTQSLNRNMLEEVIEVDIMNKCDFDLIILAMDDFKFINKTFGLSVGDVMLRQVAYYLSTLTRKGIVYRYGADQFALQIKRGKEDKEKILKEIQHRFEHPWITDEVVVLLSATICCVQYPEDGEKLETIMDVVDFSMLSAKKTEKGSIVHAKDINLKVLQEEKAIEKAVDLAINRDTVQVYFQPIFNTKRKCYTSAEALVRIYDDDLGNISPEIFIPISEKNGRIVKLGTLIFEKVCKFISEANLKETSIAYIDVNVSVVQCMQKNFANELLDIMEKYHVDASQINLEITETAAINSISILRENIEVLHAKGISFSLDDYGSGYASIGYLHKLPFQIIKIDKYMVWDAFKNRRAGIALKFTVGMLKELDVDIVAEGVETDEQRMHLERIGCNYLQGWLYSKAVPEDEFKKLIGRAS